MNKNDILDYVMNTPGNTNRAVLNSMLNSLEGTSGGGSAPDGSTFDDGKTRLFITIPSDLRKTIFVELACTIANGVTIDWGDGSEFWSLDTTSMVLEHEYPSAGDYIITIEVKEGEELILGRSGHGLMYDIAGTSSKYIRQCLKRVEIGNGVTSIGEHAFADCYTLTSVVIPEGITSIREYTFNNCTALTSVIIPEGVTSIEDEAFSNCFTLTSVVIPESVTSIGSNIFNNCLALTSITIPEGVTSIGENTFSYCSALTSVIIPEGVTNIGDGAFNGCSALTSITIPEGVTSIGGFVFSDCYSLTSVTIPEGITSIGDSAFFNCIGMVDYHFLSSTPPSIISSEAFGNIPSDCKIYIPEGSLEAYSTATNWSNYASMLIEE